MWNNELYNRMETIVKKVSQKYPGGESYFTELDEMIRNDEELIIQVINQLLCDYNCNIVSTGNFGMKIAGLLENNRFTKNFKLLVFNGGLRKGAETKLIYSNGEASNPLNSWCFVDDSFYSGKTLNAVRRKLTKKFKINCTHHFAFYDGSTNHMIESLYRYWR